jgi:hypothetical protein
MLGLLVLLAWSPAMPLAAAGQPGLCCRSAACAVPGTWKQMFACDTDTWTSHMQRPPWEWYLTAKTTQGDVIPLQCEGGLKSFSPCGSQTDCPGGDCVLVKMSAKQYLDRRLSCCRHCSWDMRFPVGAPIQVTAGNITLEPQELAIIAKYLDCNTFKAEFDAIDTLDITTGYISLEEWTKNFLSKTPQRQMIKNGMLSSPATFQAADLNKDNMLTFEEFVVFRHFWTPILLSNTAPARASNIRNADGPLGGAYYDASTVSVWVTTANNLMLRLYITNSWSSAKTREPREGEETNYRKMLDMDGEFSRALSLLFLSPSCLLVGCICSLRVHGISIAQAFALHCKCKTSPLRCKTSSWTLYTSKRGKSQKKIAINTKKPQKKLSLTKQSPKRKLSLPNLKSLKRKTRKSGLNLNCARHEFFVGEEADWDLLEDSELIM